MELSSLWCIPKLVGRDDATCRLGSGCEMSADLAVSPRVVVLQWYGDLSIIIQGHDLSATTRTAV